MKLKKMSAYSASKENGAWQEPVVGVREVKEPLNLTICHSFLFI